VLPALLSRGTPTFSLLRFERLSRPRVLPAPGPAARRNSPEPVARIIIVILRSRHNQSHFLSVLLRRLNCEKLCSMPRYILNFSHEKQPEIKVPRRDARQRTWRCDRRTRLPLPAPEPGFARRHCLSGYCPFSPLHSEWFLAGGCYPLAACGGSASGFCCHFPPYGGPIA